MFQASERMILVVVKVSVVLCGLMGAGLATTTTSVFLLWIVGADVVYSMLTPQITCTFFLSEWVNAYGACSGFVVAIVLRALVGEPMIGLPDVLPLPWDKMQEDGHRQRLFPFRTAIMLITSATILLGSYVAGWLSEENKSDGRGRDAQELEGLNKQKSHLSSHGSREEETSHFITNT